MTTIAALLRLTRISNLPTVWSNVLAASVLAGGMVTADLALVLLAMSALYTGGMVLNDVVDRNFDARERPERPLPSGAIAPATALTVGAGLLVFGVAPLAAFGIAPAVAGLILAGSILLYDAWHKGNPASPVIMGLCRALVYIGTALAAGSDLSTPILSAAVALLMYVVILTELAKRGIPHVRVLIAGIALLDAVVAVLGGNATMAATCIGLFLLTLILQRIVPGT